MDKKIRTDFIQQALNKGWLKDKYNYRSIRYLKVGKEITIIFDMWDNETESYTENFIETILSKPFIDLLSPESEVLSRKHIECIVNAIYDGRLDNTLDRILKLNR